MKAVDVMTRNVVSVKLDSSVFEAAQLMILNRISGLPVLDTSGKLVGVVTEGGSGRELIYLHKQQVETRSF